MQLDYLICLFISFTLSSEVITYIGSIGNCLKVCGEIIVS